MDTVVRYDVRKDYGVSDGFEFSSTPSWCIAVFRLGQPVTYSREKMSSVGDVISGALLRKQSPLIITSDCISLNVSGSKGNCTKQLSAVLKGDRNYLSADALLPGDWMFAWIHTNVPDTEKVVKALKSGHSANWFNSGFKFVGRVFSIRKSLSVSGEGTKSVNYTLDGVGFDELSSIFYYDPALATVESKEDVWQFFGQIGQDVRLWLTRVGDTAGEVKDNAEALVDGFLEAVVGKGVSKTINNPSDNIGTELKVSPQQNKEAPYAYLVPASVAATLGKTIADERKGDRFGHRVFGYSDLLTTLTGVQRYLAQDPLPDHQGMLPANIDHTSSPNRIRCTERIKGTYIPVEQCFVNVSLWQLINQFKNPTINEMYTCIKPDVLGNLMPTVVLRQIPFSTNAIAEKPEMPLTRFMSLPRWQIPGGLITGMDVGRSNSTRFNFVHVYGQVSPYHQEDEYSIASQMLRNPPIFDAVDVARSGLKLYQSAVNCSIYDTQRQNGARTWMEAIADWSMGMQFTLNGVIHCFGIQSPICEGDNIEVDGLVFHIDSLSHSCGIDGSGRKWFNTALNVTHGMPSDQPIGGIAPRYAGFKSSLDLTDSGDDGLATSFNPGTNKG